MDKKVLMRNIILKTASEAEHQELDAWIEHDPENADEFEDMKLLYGESGEKETGNEEKWDEAYKRIQESLKHIKKRNLRVKRWITAGMAAAITGILWSAGMDLTRKPVQGEGEAIRLTTDLSFKDTPLHTVLQALAEPNHLVVTADSGEVWECRFTGTLGKGITLAEALAILAEAESFQYTYGGRNVVLTGKGCAQAN